MAEPNLTAGLVGTGLATGLVVLLGPVLGEYAIILFTGLLGTLIALSDAKSPSFARSLIFVFRGLCFSFVFTSILTAILVQFLPKSFGITYYALMGCVSFTIGWTSNRWGALKTAIIEETAKRVAKILGSDTPPKDSP